MKRMRGDAALAVFFLTVLACQPQTGWADIRHVTPSGGGDGSGWASPTTLSNALAIGQPGDQIWIAEGVYVNNTDNANSFILATSGLSLYGGFTNGAAWADRDPDAYPTILDGEAARRVLQINAGVATIDGLIFRNGMRSADAYATGCGIRRVGTGTLHMARCAIADNRPSGQNYAYGVGAYFEKGTVHLEDCAIVDNEAKTGVWGKGIGIYAKQVTLVLNNCVLTNNARRASGNCMDGGALFIEGGGVYATNCLFAYNKPTASHDHHWGDGSGAALAVGANGEFRNCLFHHNTVYIGSTAYNFGGTIKLAPDAGAILVDQCTFAHNTPGKYGGAVKMLGGSLTVRNSIFWTNTASVAGSEIYMTKGTTTISYAILTALDTNAVLGPSALALTQVTTNNPLFPSEFDFHPMSAAGRWDPELGDWTNDVGYFSPAIDGGDPAAPADQETAPNGFRVNLGAYGNTTKASRSMAAAAPVVVNRGATVTLTSALLWGELTEGTRSDVQIFYGTNALALTESLPIYPAPETGSWFSAKAAGLIPLTTYYYACYATNRAGEDWAETGSFVTGTQPAGGGGSIIHVDRDAVGANNGRNWFDAFTTIRAAAAALSEGTNEIWIAEGVYTEGNPIVINATANIYGGFAGTESLRSERTVGHDTIVSGNQSYRVFEATGGSIRLDNLTIRDGRVAQENGTGVGILKTAGCTNLVVANCQVVQNWHAGGNSFYGVGAHFNSGRVMLTNCLFAQNNTAAGIWGRGIGFYGKAAQIDVVDCQFVSNALPSSGIGNEGGAFYLAGGSLDARRVRFEANQCLRTHANENVQGGPAGVIDAAASASFQNCLFRSNTVYATREAIDGGTLKLKATAGTVQVGNCTFAQNSPGQQGGAFRVLGGSLIVSNSILWGNTASVAGDEIYLGGGSATISWSALTGTGEEQIFGGVSLNNIQTKDPLFAGPEDLHLRSFVGRWDAGVGDWTVDAGQFSPCIDAGDPEADYAAEPADANGGRLNQGAYGNTSEASKSPAAVKPVVVTRAASVLHTVADLKAELIDGTQSDAFFYYGTDPEALAAQSPVLVVPSPQTGYVFSVHVVGLEPLTQYYYACLASNAAGAAWSDTNSFNTGEAPPGGGPLVIHVDRDAIGAQTGRNWLDAFKTLTEGAAAADGTTNEIWVADGIYSEPGTLLLATNMALYGGFSGTETTRSARVVESRPELTASWLRRVVEVTGHTVTIDGFVIRDGATDTVDKEGSGIRKQTPGVLTLVNCRLLDHRQGDHSQFGTGAHFDGCTVTLSNCVVAGCSASVWSYGIGIYARNADLTVQNSLIASNYTGGWSMGGGIYVTNSLVTVTDSAFVSNQCSDFAGGAAVAIHGTGTGLFRNCRFQANHNSTINDRGKTIRGGTMLVEQDADSTVRVENCTFAWNAPNKFGGAIDLRGGVVSLRNAIVWTNTALQGAELFASNSQSRMTVAYTLLSGTSTPHVVSASDAVFEWDAGLLTADPLLANVDDLHLKSEYGRWVAPDIWTNDPVSSPAIDAGDPQVSYGLEPKPNGYRINLGAYGGTPQASMSEPPPSGTIILLR